MIKLIIARKILNLKIFSVEILWKFLGLFLEVSFLLQSSTAFRIAISKGSKDTQ